ncbi:MAG: hypothetical protein AAFO03_08175 [Bacteroidota bacterium]
MFEILGYTIIIAAASFVAGALWGADKIEIIDDDQDWSEDYQ